MKENTLCMLSDSRIADDRAPCSTLSVLLYLQACLVEGRRTSTTMVHVVHVYDAATPSRLAGSTAHHSTGLHFEALQSAVPNVDHSSCVCTACHSWARRHGSQFHKDSTDEEPVTTTARQCFHFDSQELMLCGSSGMSTT